MAAAAAPTGSPASPAPSAPRPKGKVDNIKGMQRAMGAQSLFELAKKKYKEVLTQLEEQGVTRALSDKEERTREEYARIVQHPLMAEVHTDIAKRCLALARQNGGIYNKAAQFVSSLQAGSGDTGIPHQFVDELRQCTDACPPRPLSDFAEMFVEDFGKPWQELYRSIDEPPIGAASLAQVHRAVAADGRVVALKLQYPGLRDQLASDFFVFRCLAGMMRPAGLDLTVLLTDFEQTVTRELDFGQEAVNSETSRRALQHRHPQVYVPAIVPDLCSSRILAMEYVDNMVPLRPPRLLRAGLQPTRVSSLVADVFAEMACCHGRVHGDPHAGNVYARQLPGGKPGEVQLVLLDHGLYHLLDEPMREEFCRLLLACASRRRGEIQRLGERFAGPLGRFLPLVLSPWFIFGAPVTLADVRAAHRRRLPPGISLKQIGETLVKLYEGGGKTIGLLHSMGYTRGLLNDLGCGETVRLSALVNFARVGLEHASLRPGAREAREAPPHASAPLAVRRPPSLPLSLQFALYWATFQVWVCAVVITLLWPLAWLLEPRGNKGRRSPSQGPGAAAGGADAAGAAGGAAAAAGGSAEGKKDE
eukprot:TRINITY_DN18009_c0_g1_i1.p1 TRINITY_DN18009_c0_g1~~TRINITY_DN18009_c0_g1_i1.p1  ORF type:complete len:622 (+),score=173.56 TRINITY_DN18009_c0_g1_i1:98-1867(+)